MSFGFSISDFLALATLSWNIYNSCTGAPREYNELAAQASSLHSILRRTAEDLQQHPPESHESSALASIKDRCQGVLGDIDCLLQRRGSLGTEKPRKRDKIKWALANSSEFKDQLWFYGSLLTALNASLTQFSQARVEKKLDMLIRNIEEGFSMSACAASCPSPVALAGPDGDRSSRGGPNEQGSSRFTGEDAFSCTSPTIATTLDTGSERSLPTPSSTLLESPTSLRNSESFASSSSSSSSSSITIAPDSGNKAGHYYQRVKATELSIQVNGDFFSPLTESRARRHYYLEATASGKSLQVNGNLDADHLLELINAR